MNSQVLSAGAIVLITVIMLFHPKVPNSIAATIGAIGMALTGLLEFKAVFNYYTSTSVILMVGMMVIGGGMFHTGFAGWLGRSLTKVTGSNERGIQIMGIIVVWFLSSVCSSSAALMILFPILCSVCIASKVSMSRIMLPAFAGVGFGSFMTYSGSNMTPAASAILEEYGYAAISYFEVTPYGILRTILGAISIIWLGNKFLPDTYVAPNAAEALKAEELPTELNGKMITSAVILVVTIIGMVIDSSYCPIYMCAAIGGVATVMVGCLTEKQMFSSISWNAVFLIGGMTAVAKGVEASGFGNVLADGMLSLAGDNANPLLFIVLLYILTAVLTQFMSNSATVTIIVPIGIIIATSIGVDPRLFVMPILFASCIGNCTPMATTMIGFVMGEGGYSGKDILKWGLFESVVSIITLLIVFPFVWM